MKCPRCGLVHSAADTVCRRCEIDLKTEEPRSRTASCGLPARSMKTSAGAEESEGLGSLAREVRDKERKSGEDKSERDRSDRDRGSVSGEHPAAGRERQSRPDEGRAAVRDEDAGEDTGSQLVAVASRLQGREGTVGAITCPHCLGKMTVVREMPFSIAGPIALLVLGVALFVAGFFFHLLWITSAASLLLGVLYFRMGRSHWKCESCDFIVPRM